MTLRVYHDLLHREMTHFKYLAALIGCVALSIPAFAEDPSVTLPDLLTPAQLAEELGFTPEETLNLDTLSEGFAEMVAAPEMPLEQQLKLGKLVIIVDRSPQMTRATSQTMHVYYNGLEVPYPAGLNGAPRSFIKVSTGMEGFTTPMGYFRPINGRIYENYISQKYNAPMPYAVFFFMGVALHATGTSQYKNLGTRASHGCVRLTLPDSKWINGLVRSTWVANPGVPALSRGGMLSNGVQPGYDTAIILR